MKIATLIVSTLLGLMFLAASGSFFLHLAHDPGHAPGSMPALYMGALGPTGYMAFVKVCELIGGLLLLLPRTRNFGLLLVGPVVVNILAYWVFIEKDPLNPAGLVPAALAAFLLWSERGTFARLLRGPVTVAG